jgi:hypothetical protein
MNDNAAAEYRRSEFARLFKKLNDDQARGFLVELRRLAGDSPTAKRSNVNTASCTSAGAELNSEDAS